MSWSYCPECATRIRIPRSVRPGDHSECTESAILLELIAIPPVDLEVAAPDASGLSDAWDWAEEEEEEEDEDSYDLDDDDLSDLDDDEEDDDLPDLDEEEDDDDL